MIILKVVRQKNRLVLLICPSLSGDSGDNAFGEIRTWLALLPRQYDNMRRWKDGDFESDWKPGTNPIPEHFEDIPLEAQPTDTISHPS